VPVILCFDTRCVWSASRPVSFMRKEKLALQAELWAEDRSGVLGKSCLLSFWESKEDSSDIQTVAQSRYALSYPGFKVQAVWENCNLNLYNRLGSAVGC
jgi:hypothetical protein